MKKIIIIIATMMLLVSIVGCTLEKDNESLTQKEEITTIQEESAEYDYGAISALEKDELTIEEMLNYAIQDEYLARQEYESIMQEYGEQKPFSNIIRAEETHIELLKEIYEEYGYEIPVDNAINYVVIPESLEMAFEIGVQAEIDNIAMYEKFLENELPDDIEAIFIELRDGSKKHLAAFERGVRGNGQGR